MARIFRADGKFLTDFHCPKAPRGDREQKLRMRATSASGDPFFSYSFPLLNFLTSQRPREGLRFEASHGKKDLDELIDPRR